VFKNLTIFRVVPEWQANLAKAIEQAERKQFVECGASQQKSMGWVAPRAEHGALVESVGGQWIMKVMIEKKSVPASALNKKTDARMKKIEEQTGRKPKRKEIKDEVLRELLPQAFPKSETVVVWLDPKNRLVSIDVGSTSKADDITTLMVDTFDGFGLTMIQTNLSAATSMSGWLREREAPAGFTIDRDCQLKATDEGKSAVTYAKHGLDIEEVRLHLEQGKLPTKLAMTWDERISFVLTDAMLVKKLHFGDVVFEKPKAGGDDGFDANAAIATGELSKLIPDLIEALGGEATVEA
jgi:recombination associated protein RdgC